MSKRKRVESSDSAAVERVNVILRGHSRFHIDNERVFTCANGRVTRRKGEIEAAAIDDGLSGSGSYINGQRVLGSANSLSYDHRGALVNGVPLAEHNRLVRERMPAQPTPVRVELGSARIGELTLSQGASGRREMRRVTSQRIQTQVHLTNLEFEDFSDAILSRMLWLT